MNAPTSIRTAISTIEQPAMFLHCAIVLADKSQLDDEVFRLVSFSGQESTSEHFEFQLELHANTDESHGRKIAFDDLIGRPITVGINQASQQAADVERALSYTRFVAALAGQTVEDLRLFNGMVASLSMELPGVYRLTMRPALWRLTLTNAYRIFARKNVVDVLRELCRAHNIAVSLEGLSAEDGLALCRVQDWLQAGESDYDLLRRLMGKAHIFYYYLHSATQHTLVFANHRHNYPKVFADNRPLRITATTADALGLAQNDVLQTYSFQQNLISSGVQGVFTRQEAAWEGHPVATHYNYSFPPRMSAALGELPFKQYRSLQYGGSDNEVREYALATKEALSAGQSQFSGASSCAQLRVAHRFTVTANVMAQSAPMPIRPSLENREFVLTQVRHNVTQDGTYSNEFQATLATALITPMSVQDTQQGSVVAKVTGHFGGSPGKWPYYTPDNFDLETTLLEDRKGVQKSLLAKGVYVRFATDADDAPSVWVKLSASMQTIPEIGVSVLVARASDESELPEVQSIVQSDGSKVILDEGWTAHTQVGHSYSTSYGDSKGVRFGKNWTAALVDEAVRLVETAYKTGQFKDASYSRGSSYGYQTSESRAAGLLSESWSYGSGKSFAWAKEQRSFSATGATHHQSVVGKYDETLMPEKNSEAEAAVSSSISTTYGDTYSKSTSHGSTKSLSVYQGAMSNDSTHHGAVNSNTTMFGVSSSVTTHHADVINTSNMLANTTSTSTSAGVSTSINTQATVVSVNTTGAQTHTNITGLSNSNSVTGAVVSVDATGVTSSRSMTGVSDRTSMTGVSNDMSLLGSSAGVSITGAQSHVSVTGSTTSVNVVGSSTTVSITGDSTAVEILGSGATLTVRGSQASLDLSGPKIDIPVIVIVL